MKFCPLPSSEKLVVLITSLVFRYKGFKDHTNYRRPPSWRTSYIIYPFSVDPGPQFVDHVGHFLSACPIGRISKPSVSCSNQSNIVQGSFPH